ncbi:MAG: glycosyltransferase family 2 protein [Bacteroidales bacterium]|jgi:glycosyltransferase involved in cell wall biosynthesis
MIKISAVIITYNEERNIERCIKSLQGIVDEIIVVDSFSTDKTKEICLANNVKFYARNWEGFGNQKNFGIHQAVYDYVLSIDADEALSEILKQSIIKIKNSITNDDAYEMNRLTNYCGQWIKHCGWYPDRKLRIWNRLKGLWDDADVHEKIEFKTPIKKQLLQGDLHHYSYYTFLEHFERITKYSILSANKAFKLGEKSSIIKIIFSPFLRFVRNYFFKLGILDGFYGYTISKIEAHGVFVKYLTLYKLGK